MDENSVNISGNGVKGKNNFWQIVRGICILAVVMIHCPAGSDYAAGSIQFNTWLIIRQFINFPVATFVFLSGYFTNAEKIQGKIRTYVLKRGGRLLIPFILWSLFYSAVSIASSLHNGESISWLGYAYRFVIGKASTPFYYIVVLFQLTLLTPWLIWVIRRGKVLSRLLWLLTPVYLILIYYWNFTDTLPTLFGTVFPAWFFFYYLGLNVNLLPERWKKIAGRFGKWHLPCIMILLSIAEAFLVLKGGCGFSFASSQIKYTSFAYVFLLILCLLNLNEKKAAKPFKGRAADLLKKTGDYSFGIFFIHCFILRFVTKALRIFGIDSIWILYFLLTWAILSAVSFAVVMAVNKMLGNSKSGKKILSWIGFR